MFLADDSLLRPESIRSHRPPKIRYKKQPFDFNKFGEQSKKSQSFINYSELMTNYEQYYSNNQAEKQKRVKIKNIPLNTFFINQKFQLMKRLNISSLRTKAKASQLRDMFQSYQVEKQMNKQQLQTLAEYRETLFEKRDFQNTVQSFDYEGIKQKVLQVPPYHLESESDCPFQPLMSTKPKIQNINIRHQSSSVTNHRKKVINDLKDLSKTTEMATLQQTETKQIVFNDEVKMLNLKAPKKIEQKRSQYIRRGEKATDSVSLSQYKKKHTVKKQLKIVTSMNQ